MHHRTELCHKHVISRQSREHLSYFNQKLKAQNRDSSLSTQLIPYLGNFVQFQQPENLAVLKYKNLISSSDFPVA